MRASRLRVLVLAGSGGLALLGIVIAQASLQMQSELARVLGEQERMIWIGRERLAWIERQWGVSISGLAELKSWERPTSSASRLHVWEEQHSRLSSEIAPRAARLLPEAPDRYRELETIERRFESQRLLYVRSVAAYNESIHWVPPMVRRMLRLAHAPQLFSTPRIDPESQ